jgi:multicomponent Na+:H+ antiporter subunit C
MSGTLLFWLLGSALIGLGVYGIAVNRHPLRKLLALNLLGSGVFLLFGVIARRGASAGLAGDPVPQALVITGIVVAFSATAIAIALLLQLQSKTGDTSLVDQPEDDGDAP